jgi:putative peptidoglycan lipid II flippase
MHKTSHLLKSTAVVSLFTGVSRTMGLAREMLMAYFFGTSLAKSAFDVAFRIPNLFRQLFGEGALSAAFVPVFASCLAQEGRAAANRLAGRVFSLLLAVLVTLSALGLLVIWAVLRACPLAARPSAVLPLLAIMLPYLIFICLVALCMGVLNSIRHFALPAATPVLLNLTWIAALYLICPWFGDNPADRIYGVAWGILLAGVLQLAVQFPVLRRFDALPDFRALTWRGPHVMRVVALMAPAAVGMGLHQINVVVDGILALWVAEWAPAALTYAERLVYLPLGLFATALGTVLLPTFSEQAALADHDRLRRTFRHAMSGLLLIMIPAAVGLAGLAASIVKLVFEWHGGAFDADSTNLTARALYFYAPGLIVFSAYKVIVPVFYALQDTRTPVRVGVLCVGVNFVLNILFVLTWPVGYRHAGLACATVLSSGLNGVCLGAIASRRIGALGWRSIAWVAARAGVAAGVMLAGARGVQAAIAGTLFGAGKYGQAVAVLAAIVVGAGIYGLLAALLCRREWRRLLAGGRQART